MKQKIIKIIHVCSCQYFPKNIHNIIFFNNELGYPFMQKYHLIEPNTFFSILSLNVIALKDEDH